MKHALTIAIAATLVAGVTFAQDAPAVKEITGEDELVKEKSKQFLGGVWIRPDADISKYENLYLWNAVFQFRDVEGKANQTTIAMSRGDQGPYAIDKESQEKFKEIVSEAVVKELARSKQFKVVEVVQPRTLLVRGAVADIVSYVPPNVGRYDNIHLASVGEATIIFELIDAETGVIQARVGDRRAIAPPIRVNQVNAAPTTSATVMNDVEQWARDQASTLRRALDKAAKKANKK
jgi:hypothetical protein